MNCPVCSNKLSQRIVAGITLDVCDGGCAGIWFDQFEFKKFDEQSEPDAETLLHLSRKIPAPAPRDFLECPKCQPKTKMMRHFSSVKRKVTIDECPKCAGVWLDAGELHAIREEFATEADRRKAAESVFDEMFSATLKEEHQRSEAKLAKAHSFAHALRFICPSYYFPGKQNGGAF